MRYIALVVAFIGGVLPVSAANADVFDFRGNRVDVSYAGAEMYIHTSSGATLFEGGINKRDNSISGTANVPIGRCGVHTYRVTGYLSMDGERIVLSGEAPVLNDRCRVIGRIKIGPNAILDFDKFHY